MNDIICDLISRDYEEDWFEFKANWFDAHQLGEYISGMSNAAVMAGQEYAYFIRGVPAIVGVYGKNVFRFAENNIKVTIPFERFNSDNTPVEVDVTPVNTPVESDDRPISERIIEYCIEPKGILEIASLLGYKEKRP